MVHPHFHFDGVAVAHYLHFAVTTGQTVRWLERYVSFDVFPNKPSCIALKGGRAGQSRRVQNNDSKKHSSAECHQVPLLCCSHTVCQSTRRRRGTLRWLLLRVRQTR